MTFWLPVDGPPGAGPSLERIGSILINDDEADVRELVADVLGGLGHCVTVAGGGREGLARFETGRYDLVLTDLGMPDFNGWDVARAVKATRADVPVLLLTGWADVTNPAECAARRGDHQEALRLEAARGSGQPGARRQRTGARLAGRGRDGSGRWSSERGAF